MAALQPRNRNASQGDNPASRRGAGGDDGVKALRRRTEGLESGVMPEVFLKSGSARCQEDNFSRLIA